MGEVTIEKISSKDRVEGTGEKVSRNDQQKVSTPNPLFEVEKLYKEVSFQPNDEKVQVFSLIPSIFVFCNPKTDWVGIGCSNERNPATNGVIKYAADIRCHDGSVVERKGEISINYGRFYISENVIVDSWGTKQKISISEQVREIVMKVTYERQRQASEKVLAEKEEKDETK